MQKTKKKVCHVRSSSLSVATIETPERKAPVEIWYAGAVRMQKIDGRPSNPHSRSYLPDLGARNRAKIKWTTMLVRLL